MNIRKASYMLLPFLLLSGCSNKESASIPSSENTTTEDNEIMYQYGDKEKYQNFLTDSIIYNEIVTLVEEDGEIYGKLLYEPKKIISIRDYSLHRLLQHRHLRALYLLQRCSKGPVFLFSPHQTRKELILFRQLLLASLRV